jgi:hypothetical protein
VLKSDAHAGGTIFTGGMILTNLGQSGGTINGINQYARYFSSPEAAQAWVKAARDAKSSCPDFTVAADAGPTKVHQEAADSGLKSDGFKLEVTATSAGSKTPNHVEVWTLRNGNAVVVLSGGVDSAKAAKDLISLVTFEDQRVSSKISANGIEEQTTTQACAALTASGKISSTDIWDASRGVSTTDGRSIDQMAADFATGAKRVTNSKVKPLSDAVATDLNELAQVDAANPGGPDMSSSDPILKAYNKLGSAVGKLGCMGEGWTME